MEHIREFIRRYRDVGLLIDANLLLLFFVGLADRTLIARHERTSKFTADDFDLLDKFAGQFRPIVTTPNILTLVVNLAGQCSDSQS